MKKLIQPLLFTFLVPCMLLMMTAGCSKKSDPTPGITAPVLTTTAVTAITQTTASSGGNVTSTGGATVTVWGICWSKSANPAISDFVCGGGSSSANFTCGMTGLDVNTLYYVRAFATNSAGTTYGDQKSFTTLPFSNPVFTVAVSINASAFTVAFTGTCTNDDVKMTKVIITDPEGVSSWTYEMNDVVCLKNHEFNLQNPGSSYPWLTGHWTIEFIGTRVVNGASFDITKSVFV
jgi:hypothetical protein